MATLITQVNSDGSKRSCNAKCYNAKHTRCTCVCGGANHGVGFEQAVENTAEMAKDLLERTGEAKLAQFIQDMVERKEGEHGFA